LSVGTPRRRELLADLPGRYLARLMVTGPDGRSSSDLVTVTADAVPNAQIHTLAESPDDVPGNVPGIQLDSSWWCANGTTDTSCLFHANPGGTGYVQMLALERGTLQVLCNESYSPSDLQDMERTITQMATGVSTSPLNCNLINSNGINDIVPADDLLVVITLDSGTVTDVTHFSAAVSQIGMPAYDSSVTSVPGPYSIIGIPGMSTGKAWQNFGEQIGTNAQGDANPAGSLDGYLKDSAYWTTSTGNLPETGRVFTFPDVVGFETRVVDGTDVAVQLQDYNPSQIDYSTTTLATFSATGGLGIVTIDPYTLDVVEAKKWSPDTPAIDWASVADQLQDAVDAGDGVVIVSLGQMSGYLDEPTASSFQEQVLPLIRTLGGQPDIFARAVNDNATYSFIGVGGQGAESSSVVLTDVPRSGDGTLPVAAGNLTGELRRGNDGRFIPSQADPNGIYQSELNPILYQAPVDWLYTPPAGATQADLTTTETALAWLAKCKFLGYSTPSSLPPLWDGQDCSTDGGNNPVDGTPDVGAVYEVALWLRTQYYDNSALSFNDDFGNLTYSGLFPAGNEVFASSDFATAQGQLTKEKNAVNAASGFFTQTLEPLLAGDQNNLTSQMTQVANTVQQDYFAQQQTITVTNYAGWASQLFTNFATAGATVTALFADGAGIGEVFQFAALLSDGGSMFQTLVNGPQTSSIDIEAWLLLNEQLQNVTVDVDTAVENSVSLQQQGLEMAREAVLSDWNRTKTIAGNVAGWGAINTQYGTQILQTFIISTRQQLWQGYANRLWTAGYTPGVLSATQWGCEWTDGIIDATSYIFLPFAKSGLPTGLGHGYQYWPVQTISTTASDGGRNYPSWIPYVMWEKGSQGVAPPPLDAVAAISEQPSSLQATASSAGAYGPWFWPAAFDLTRKLSDCNSNIYPQTTAGDFYGQISD